MASAVWGDDGKTVLVGGDLSELKKKALRAGKSVVAFGQKSGKEVSAGQMSMDWVLQRYTSQSAKLLPQDFVGIEVQSIDITGNYREPWQAYRQLKQGERVRSIPDSGHGLNWANVHKRLIPQIVRKGRRSRGRRD